MVEIDLRDCLRKCESECLERVACNCVSRHWDPRAIQLEAVHVRSALGVGVHEHGKGSQVVAGSSEIGVIVGAGVVAVPVE